MALQDLFSIGMSSVAIIAVATLSVGVAYKYYIYNTETTLLNRVRQVEAVRAQDGLPSEVTITPEDFRLNPELAEILGVTDLNNNVNVALETNAHLELIQFQETMEDQHNLMENITNYVLHTDFLEDIINFLLFYLT